MSSFYKESDDFTPTSLAPKKDSFDKDWQPASLSAEEQPERLVDKSPKTKSSDSPSPEPLSSQNDSSETVTAGIEDPAENQNLSISDDDRPEISPSMPDLESIQKEAYAAGIVQGRKQAETDFGSATSALTLVCDQLNTLRETILKNSKNEMLELVLALSEKIIRHSLTEQNQTIVDTVESAIHSAVKSSEFYVYLHPDDMQTIQERSQSFISGLNGLENLIIKSDNTIERGGCKVESENCTVDATIASQFKVLQDTLRKDG